jgi:hypothetical protein
MRWDNSNFYPKKCQDLRNCTLTIGKPPDTLIGHDYLADNIIRTLEKFYNFKIQYVDFDENGPRACSDLIQLIANKVERTALEYITVS